MANRADLFADIDSMEPDRFAAHLAENVRFRFGNAEPIHGREAVRDTWAAFCEGVDGVRHDQVGFWEVGEASIAEAEVTYTRKDGSTRHPPRRDHLPHGRRADRRLPHLHGRRAAVRAT